MTQYHNHSYDEFLGYLSKAQVGYPRELFLAINSVKLWEVVWFLQAYKNAYYTQHIKNLGSVW